MANWTGIRNSGEFRYGQFRYGELRYGQFRYGDSVRRATRKPIVGYSICGLQ